MIYIHVAMDFNDEIGVCDYHRCIVNYHMVWLKKQKMTTSQNLYYTYYI